MDTKQDIGTRGDIESFVIEFYERVKKNEEIGIIFNEIVNIDWGHHIPLITDFWETILLDNPVYRKNAMEKHFEVNRLIPLTRVHFDAWLGLFTGTIDDLFEGPVAELAKKRARSIADIMLLKMNQANQSSL
ncbi:MAG: group III truncated hemoglobin [Chitinophagaceae bacterium]|nr:MAG: group III truncated hemoglobin [Chitinophagaceae bacterium]